MDEARRFADRFTHGAQKSDGVVIGLAFDRMHALEVHAGATNRGHRLSRDDATTRPGRADRNFDLHLPVDTVTLAPDRAHFRQRVALDHAPALHAAKYVDVSSVWMRGGVKLRGASDGLGRCWRANRRN